MLASTVLPRTLSCRLLLRRPRPSTILASTTNTTCTTTTAGTPTLIARRFLAKAPAGGEDPGKRKKAQAKAPRNKSKHDKRDSDVKSQYQKDLDNIIAALDAPVRYEPPITVAEQERRRQIVRNYCVGNFQRHNEMEHDLSCKMKVKLHAIRMLPQQSKLKKAALDTDVGDDPPLKGFPVWTPPIPGYNPSDYEDYMGEDED